MRAEAHQSGMQAFMDGQQNAQTWPQVTYPICDVAKPKYYDDGVCEVCHEASHYREPLWLRVLRWVLR